MTLLKAKLDAKIEAMLLQGTSSRIIARRLIFYDATTIFSTHQERGFRILNEISEHFHVPFSDVRVVGSAQFGYSYFSGRDFTPKVSDLDLAIISPELFRKYVELCYSITDRYTNQVKFHRKDGVSTANEFRTNLSAGYFRPDLMPNSKQKDNWFAFFSELTNRYIDLFDNINAGIFLSDGLLEMRNTNLMVEYRKGSK